MYQDLALFDNLAPAANFFAGRELAGPTLAAAAVPCAARPDDVGADPRARRPPADHPARLRRAGCVDVGGQRQAVAVARAVAFSSKLVILDEPTAALGLRESARVLDLIRRLKDDGVAVILISHSMDHVLAVADRAVVLRRGRAVGELVPTTDNVEQLVAWIVGAADGTRTDDTTNASMEETT